MYDAQIKALVGVISWDIGSLAGLRLIFLGSIPVSRANGTVSSQRFLQRSQQPQAMCGTTRAASNLF